MGFLDKKNKEEVKPEPTEVIEETPEEEKEEVTAEPQDIVEEHKEITPEDKKKEEKHKFVVVKELPTQVVRSTVAEDGTILNFITIEEALTEAINK